MLVIAVAMGLALTFNPLPTPPNSATAAVAGLDRTVPNVSD